MYAVVRVYNPASKTIELNHFSDEQSSLDFMKKSLKARTYVGADFGGVSSEFYCKVAQLLKRYK